MVYDAVHLLSLCSIVVSVFYLYLSAYLLRANHRERLNQVFSAVCLSLFCWSFAYTFLPLAPGKVEAWFWFRLSAVGWALSPSLLLHFFLLLSGRQNWLEPRWVAPAIYAPGLIFLAFAWFGHLGVVDFVQTPYGWSDVYGAVDAPFVAFLTFFPGFILGGLLLVWQWGRRSPLAAQKREARNIVVAGVPVLAAVSVSGILLPWLGIREPPEVAHLIAPLWVLVIWHSVAVYRLMLMTPAGFAADILRTMADAVILLSREQRIITVNESAERLLGAAAGQLEGEPIDGLFDFENGVEMDAVCHLLDSPHTHELELLHRSRNGGRLPVRVSVSAVQDRRGQIAGHVLVLRDLRDEKRVEAELEHLATHDILTGLPNRSLLHDRLQRALDRAVRDKKPFALLMFDLNGFKSINDTYGQKVGDIVLQSTARRLSHATRGLDTVCRLGGDEFLLVVEDLVESGDADLVARRILAAFDEPIGAGNHVISLTASVGISVYPFDGLDPETLVKKADLALSSSKERETGGFQYYAPRMDAVNRERTRMEQGLRLALARGELYLVYQPLVELDSGRIAGVEALLRWRSAEMGLIGPNRFIPVAERCGLIVPIGEWVMESACRANRQWQTEGLPWFPVSVNISPRQLQEPDFVATVEEILRRTGLSPGLLELELTESTAMADFDQCREILYRLKDLGVRIVVDDFGTGYSSLVRMKLIPMDAVKVDRSFIEHISEDPRDRALVMAIVALARNLGVEVVAEGVETPEQLEVLRSFRAEPIDMFHCDKIQGNLFSAPVAATEVPRLFRRRPHTSDGGIWRPRRAADG